MKWIAVIGVIILLTLFHPWLLVAAGCAYVLLSYIRSELRSIIRGNPDKRLKKATDNFSQAMLAGDLDRAIKARRQVVKARRDL